MAAARSESAVIKHRAPLEVRWDDGRPSLLGFVFGLGAFVRATSLAHNVHKLGAFHSISVGMSVLGALVGTVMGGKRDQWRAGVPLCLAIDGQEKRTADRFLVLATTLKRLPLGVEALRPAARGPEVPGCRRAAPPAARRLSGPAGRQGVRLVAPPRLPARRRRDAADHHRPAAGRRRRRL
jgi:hypothetical protein